MKDLSVVIPARNEHPAATFTLQSIWDQLSKSGLDWETILVADSCTDKTGTYAKERWWGARGRHKVLTGRWGSCWRARNAGIRKATGEFVFLFDAHILVMEELFRPQLEFFRQNPGVTIVYTPMVCVADTRKHTCYGYSLSNAEGPTGHMDTKFWGSWTKRKLSDEPYMMPMSGTAGIAIRKTYLDTIGGWPIHMDTYGGGEQFISMLCWMLGGTCWIYPSTYFYHLRDHRGYAWTNEAVFHNISMVSYILGGEKWWQKTLDRRLESSNKAYHDGFYEIAVRARDLGGKRRAWVKENAIYTLDQVLERRPWEDRVEHENVGTACASGHNRKEGPLLGSRRG